jgi:hypothetical protein
MCRAAQAACFYINNGKESCMRKRRRSSRFTPLLRIFLTALFLLSLGAGMSLYDVNYAFNHIFVNGVSSEAQVADPDTPLVIPAPTGSPVSASPTSTIVRQVASATATATTPLSPTATHETQTGESPTLTTYRKNTQYETPLPSSTPSYSYTYTGSDRITLLVLGVDQRNNEPIDTTRSDTMILLTFDPATSSAGML